MPSATIVTLVVDESAESRPAIDKLVESRYRD
jgi:hypothetical protein